jgi:hypothetical protein
MRSTAILVGIALLTGCASIADRDKTLVGSADITGKPLRHRQDIPALPKNFAITPEEVAAKYGELCKAKYYCAYYIDDAYYYIVPDYVHCFFGTISTCATARVHGATGELRTRAN